MITLATIKRMQESLVEVLKRNIFLRKAMLNVLRDRDLTKTERAWIREFMYTCIQLKNRYRMAVEKFAAEDPQREDSALDIRLFFVCRYLEQKSHSSVEKAVYSLLRTKSRVHKFRSFMARTKPEEIYPHRSTDLPAYLWIYHSHPLWMVRKWLGIWDEQEVIQLCRFNNSAAVPVLRINPNKGGRDQLLEKLRDEGRPGESSLLSPFAILADRKLDPLTHAGYREGKFTLQSLSSQLVCLYINPRPGRRLLDYCAGEGGKTLLLAHLMKNKGEIHAHDKQLWRLQNLKKRARLEELGNIRLDGLRVIRQIGPGFDQVVLDVPCSGTGSLRGQPELRWKITPKDLTELNHLQLQILDEGSPFCKPGGLLYYITCSLFAEENHKVIRRFLNSRPGWELITPADYLQTYHAKGFWVTAETLRPFTDERYFQILPQRHGLPGMFCAVLRRLNEPGKE